MFHNTMNEEMAKIRAEAQAYYNLSPEQKQAVGAERHAMVKKVTSEGKTMGRELLRLAIARDDMGAVRAAAGIVEAEKELMKGGTELLDQRLVVWREGVVRTLNEAELGLELDKIKEMDSQHRAWQENQRQNVKKADDRLACRLVQSLVEIINQPAGTILADHVSRMHYASTFIENTKYSLY